MKTPSSRFAFALSLAGALCGAASAQPSGSHPGGAPSASPAPPLDWQKLEAPILRNHVQLTSRDKFVKAGEAYFAPNGRWIIFQAVPVPEEGKEPDPFYSMYVAKLTRSPEGRITGIEEPILVSPPGSANTCGWFNPNDPSQILFGSTLTPPAEHQGGGFQVGTNKYKWQFPEETEVVTRRVKEIYEDWQANLPKGTKVEMSSAVTETPIPLFTRPRYDAEGSWSADGRYVLYTHVREVENPKPADPKDAATKDSAAPMPTDGDLWVYDTHTGKQTVLVKADGYDGGPFFSPDGKWICYRSDRRGDNALQLFTAELAFNAEGDITGIKREVQLTDNEHVNWAPFWHPSGKFLIYGSSAMGHDNYEVFAIEFNPAKSAKELRTRRITQASFTDILPVFSPDGKAMMWTSQRGGTVPGEQRPSSQVWAAEVVPGAFDDLNKFFGGAGAPAPAASPSKR